MNQIEKGWQAEWSNAKMGKGHRTAVPAWGLPGGVPSERSCPLWYSLLMDRRAAGVWLFGIAQVKCLQ